MKRDLERFGDAMTPQEERKVWSRIRENLDERKRGEGSFPVAWFTRLSLAAGVALLAVALWRGGETPPMTGDEAPSPLQTWDMGRVADARDESGEAAAAAKEAGEAQALDDLAEAESAAETPVPARDILPETAPSTAAGIAAPDSAARFVIQVSPASGPGEIRGRVTNADGSPLPYAQITVLGTSRGTMSTNDGSFLIAGVPDGTYELKVMATGYEDLTVSDVVVRQNEVVDLAARLEASPDDGRIGDDIVGAFRNEAVSKTAEAPHMATGRKDGTEASPPVPEDQVRGMVESFHGGEGAGFREKGSPYPSFTGGENPVNDELADDMFFKDYGVNPLIDTEEDNQSTFGLDVDTGSYTIARSYITEGRLPPASAVRVEEFVNYFRKDYAPPKRGDFRIQVDGMPSPFAHVRDGSYYLLRIGIRGRVVDSEDRRPAQIVLVVDASGSMAQENRIDLLKSSLDVLLDELRPDDEIAVVAFSTTAWVVLPLTEVGEAWEIRRALHSLTPKGSTNAEQGLRLGYRMLREEADPRKLQRIILCSDGVANMGNTGSESILEEVREESERVPLTTIGFGMGNYNDVLMEQLADAGDGQYAYVDDIKEATRVLRENLTGTLQLIARNTKAQIEFDPDKVARYRLIGYENRDVRDRDFRNDAVDAGEIGAGHEVTALYEIKLRPERGRGSLAVVRLRYEKPEGGTFKEIEETVRTGDLARALETSRDDLLLDGAVAEFGEILRGSYWAKDSTPSDVLALLRQIPRGLAGREEVREFRGLVERAAGLWEPPDKEWDGGAEE